MANNIERATEGIEVGFHGRLDIYTAAESITAENVLEEVNKALFWHAKNLWEETELLWYRRGVQPILNRTKKRNKFVCNKVVENTYEEVVTFKSGYFLTQPCSYISRTEESQERVRMLNEYLYRSGKIQADNDIVNWFHTVGKACLLVEPGDDDETPIKAYCLDPRQAFVVYSVRPGNKPMMGVNAVTIDKTLFVDVYTADAVYRLYGESAPSTTTKAMWPLMPVCSAVTEVLPNTIGKVPMVEYRYNSENMSAPEPALPLLNALNTVLSNRLDGIEQFVQSLMVVYNADLPEGEDASTIKDSGILLLKSTGEQKSDIKILAEQLDQGQTQTLVDYIYNRVLSICKLPIVRYGMTSTSDTGAAALSRDGWYQADNDARNTEDEFKRSNRYFDEIFVEVLRRRGLLDISTTAFELQFVRNETSNVVSKSQALLNLLNAGMAPVLAFGKSGISNDPLSDVAMSEKWLKLKLGDPDREPTAEDQVIEEATDEVTTEEVVDNGTAV